MKYLLMCPKTHKRSIRTTIEFIIVSSFYVFLALLIGCVSKPTYKQPHVPKYKIGDCVNMEAMAITDDDEWDSSGHILGSLKILEIIHTDKMNKYMSNRLHAQDFYKVRIIPVFEKDRGYYGNTAFVIPMEDLDEYRYSSIFWELPENAKYGCNNYSEKK